MKKIFLFLLLVVSFTVTAQKTYSIEKPLQLNTVNKGAKSDSVLVRGVDKIVKYIPRSEFGSTPTLAQVTAVGSSTSDAIFVADSYGTAILASTAIGVGYKDTNTSLSSKSVSVSNGSTGKSTEVQSNNILLKHGTGSSLALKGPDDAPYPMTQTFQAQDGVIALLSDIIVPASATAPGIVNNVSLQELGGVDKLINGVRIGKGSGNGINNTTLGLTALDKNTTGDGLVAIGDLALTSNTTGGFNTAVGTEAATSNTTGGSNLAIGSWTLHSNTTGSYNMAIGALALSTNVTGEKNTAVGAASLGFATGSRNTGVGYLALASGSVQNSGNNNIGIGYQTGSTITTGSNNTLIGSFASNQGITTGNTNIVIKHGAISDIGLRTGSNNLLLGGASIPVDSSNLVVISDGLGIIALKKETNGELKAPSLTNALIITGGVKSLITKEYLDMANKKNIGLPVFADNIAALAGSLVIGDLYRTATGVLMVTY